jgi:filamentous hemagglutinin
MYSLNPNHLIGFHKAKMWKLYLGLTTNDINFIICEIRRLVPLYVAKQVTDSGYGMRYEVYIEMNGKEDKTAVVFTAWIDCITKNETRLLTAFPKPGKEALLI